MQIRFSLMQLRFKHGLSHEEFAKMIKISSRTLRRWESGERTPSLYHLKKIIDKFRVKNIYSFIYGKREI